MTVDERDHGPALHDNFNGGETDHEGLSKNVCFLWQTAGQGQEGCLGG